MEICSRALSFWTYQVAVGECMCVHVRERERVRESVEIMGRVVSQSHQEKAYQEYCASKAMEKAQAQESHYRQTIAVHSTENSCMYAQEVYCLLLVTCYPFNYIPCLSFAALKTQVAGEAN